MPIPKTRHIQLVILKHLPLSDLFLFILFLIVRIIFRIIMRATRHGWITPKARLSHLQISLVQPEIPHHPIQLSSSYTWRRVGSLSSLLPFIRVVESVSIRIEFVAISIGSSCVCAETFVARRGIFVFGVFIPVKVFV